MIRNILLTTPNGWMMQLGIREDALRADGKVKNAARMIIEHVNPALIRKDFDSFWEEWSRATFSYPDGNEEAWVNINTTENVASRGFMSIYFEQMFQASLAKKLALDSQHSWASFALVVPRVLDILFNDVDSAAYCNEKSPRYGDISPLAEEHGLHV